MTNDNGIITATPTGEAHTFTPSNGIAYEDILFLLKNKDNTFGVRLTDILECMFFAQEKGFLPPFPEGCLDWKWCVMGMYGIEPYEEDADESIQVDEG